MTYDVVDYWRGRGSSYETSWRAIMFAAQEAALERLLEDLAFDTVLDVGCGFGRLGELVLRIRPEATYTGLDLSADQLEAARRRLPDVELVQSTIAGFDAGGRRWDLVLASEVLMHQPRGPELEDAIARIRELAGRHIVTIDWSYPLEHARIQPHNFLHDYRALFGPEALEIPVGRQAIWHQVSHPVSHATAERAVSSGPERALGE